MFGIGAIFITWVARAYGKKTPPHPFMLFFFGGQIVWFMIDAIMFSNTSWYAAHKGTTARYVYIGQIVYVLCLLPFSPKQRVAAPSESK